jgi:hypothetical protein
MAIRVAGCVEDLAEEHNDGLLRRHDRGVGELDAHLALDAPRRGRLPPRRQQSLFERPQRTLQATMVASSTSKWARASKTDDGGFQPGRLNMFSPYAAALSRTSKT